MITRGVIADISLYITPATGTVQSRRPKELTTAKLYRVALSDLEGHSCCRLCSVAPPPRGDLIEGDSSLVHSR